MSDPLPILAHGESYAQPVQKKTGGGSKPRPHEYEEARNRLLANIGAVSRQMQTDPDSYLEEKVVCIRMEPKFEAKSYAPSSVLTSSDELQVIGGRRYKTGNVQPQKNSNDEDAGEQLEFAKLYFLRTTSKGLADFENALRTGSNESDAWRNEVMSIRSFDLLEPGEKILGFDAEWKEGLVEAVLHPLQESAEDAVDLFCKAAGLGRDEIEVRSYKDGVTFIAAQLSREATMAAARINPLRTVHPMGRIAFEPIRSAMSAPAPQVAAAQNVPPVTVGVFDGGCNPNVPLLSGYVNAHDAVASLPDQDGIDHGTGVCGAVLHGELSGKGASDVLPAPEVKVESFRVLPPSDPIDIDLYESIDAIEYVVGHNPDSNCIISHLAPLAPFSTMTSAASLMRLMCCRTTAMPSRPSFALRPAMTAICQAQIIVCSHQRIWSTASELARFVYCLMVRRHALRIAVLVREERVPKSSPTSLSMEGTSTSHSWWLPQAEML